MKSEWDDESLFAGIQRDNRRALEYFFKSFFDPLTWFSLKITGNLEESRDIAIRAIQKVLEKKEDFKEITPMKTFMYLTARNSSLNYLRQQQTHALIHETIKDQSALTDEDTDSKFQGEIIQMIWQVINSLPQKDQDIMKLSYLEDLKTHEIAMRLNKTEQYVRNCRQRVFQKIRKALEDKRLPMLVMLVASLAYYI